MKIVVALALVLLSAAPALAQVDLRTTPPQRERPDFVTPGPYYEMNQPREHEWYPHGVRVPFDPAFIDPMSEEYETATSRGRYGVAGWTSQHIPISANSSHYREQNGWLMFGFAFTWGAAPRTPGRPASAPQQRPVPAR